jgi:hypothetical protein
MTLLCLYRDGQHRAIPDKRGTTSSRNVSCKEKAGLHVSVDEKFKFIWRSALSVNGLKLKIWKEKITPKKPVCKQEDQSNKNVFETDALS